MGFPRRQINAWFDSTVKLLRNLGKGVGGKISAIRTRGAELAGLDNFTVKLDGETLGGGGIREGVEVEVASVLPFLVLKAFAIEERDKAKDRYDVVWILNAFKGGPRSAAEAIASRGYRKQSLGRMMSGPR
jgi:hypothetical protein